MMPKELSVLLNELLSFINHSSLIKNEALIELIWNRSKQFEGAHMPADCQSKDYLRIHLPSLFTEGTNLWNTTIDIRLFIKRRESQKMKVLAMLKDTCFRIFKVNEQWKKDEQWTYLQVTISTLKTWLECGDLEQLDSSLIDEMAKFTTQCSSEDSNLTNLKVILQSYIYQSEYKIRKHLVLGIAEYPYSFNTDRFPFTRVSFVNACQDHHLLIKEINESLKLADILDSVLSKEKKRSIKYFLAKISILLKSADVNDYASVVQREYFGLVENVEFSYGLDLLIHRIQEEANTETDLGFLYLFKFNILSEITIENFKKNQLELDENVIRASIDDIYLIKEDIDPLNIATIQAITWATADFFYNQKLFQLALPWYRYSYHITKANFVETNNSIVVARKLSTCYLESNDGEAAYTCYKKGIEDAGKNVTVKDYMWLLKCGFNQSSLSTKEDQLIRLEDFQLEDFVSVLEYCYLWCKDCSVIQIVLGHVFEFYKHKDKAKGLVLTNGCFIHLLVLSLRCILHTKTTLYESVKQNSTLNIRKLRFKSIAHYINNICTLLQISGSIEQLIQQTPALKDDLLWMVYTCWNFGLFCFGAERNDEGVCLFECISKLSLHCNHVSFEGFTPEQSRIRTFLFATSYLMLFEHNTKKSQIKEDAHLDNTDIINTLESLKIAENDSITLLASIFEIEIYVKQTMFEKAYALFESYIQLPTCSFSIVERMGGIILLNKECPIEIAFMVVKALHLTPKLQEKGLVDYAKWSCILVSIAIKKDTDKDLYDCFEAILEHKLYIKKGFPQKELYYLIVIAWNKGITSCFQSNQSGRNWCDIAFRLLQYLNEDEGKKQALQEQMYAAYSIFDDTGDSQI
ncbi:hypothetical protein A0J61_06784 [Choanephora cucurbitarum]|uniref:Protein ZIP4 homolog n=1 Tax=Choanephora cucurbitarum TaxID=101091 RepID=A0A1C7N7P9_9FUNG|nr:hypothetical protein A0J61_06784 [Choanephora cucurbitarum]